MAWSGPGVVVNRVVAPRIDGLGDAAGRDGALGLACESEEVVEGLEDSVGND